MTSSALVQDANTIFRTAVERVQAPTLIAENDRSTWAPEALRAYSSIRVVGVGKAALTMAGSVEERLSGRALEGVVVVPEGYSETVPPESPVPSDIQIIEGGHPLPTQESVRAARRIRDHADAAGAEDLVLVLVSGGGTALSTLPVPGLDLADLRFTYQQMLEGGVEVHQMNAVRKHVTQVGGGQLARAAQPATVASLVVSDVVGDDMSVIASGPTVADSTTYEDAIRVLYAHGLWHDVPAAIREHLVDGAEGRQPETPGSDADCFERTANTLLGTNRTALAAARDEAEARGYEVRRVREEIDGEARLLGKEHAETLRRTDVSTPTCWLWGGETTVTVTGEGTGGRNQEVALGGALGLEGASTPAVLLSAGTDGIDGPTNAAGAWATLATADAARAAGCDPEAHLQANDAYPLFDAIDQLIRTGPTHTNVMDVHIGLVAPG